MKIKEAVNIINSTETVRASLEKEKIYFYEDTVSKFDYFLAMPQKVNNWDNVEEDFEALYSITPKDLARVMDVIQRLLDTPVKERFPEKSYLLVAKRKPDRPGLPKYVKAMATGVNEFNFYLTDDKSEAEVYKESLLEEIKKREPSLAPAIDAMKEPVEDEND